MFHVQYKKKSSNIVNTFLKLFFIKNFVTDWSFASVISETSIFEFSWPYLYQLLFTFGFQQFIEKFRIENRPSFISVQHNRHVHFTTSCTQSGDVLHNCVDLFDPKEGIIGEHEWHFTFYWSQGLPFIEDLAKILTNILQAIACFHFFSEVNHWLVDI